MFAVIHPCNLLQLEVATGTGAWEPLTQIENAANATYIPAAGEVGTTYH
jgi:hypothetical protein